MKANMGNADKTIRLVVAAIILFLYYLNAISGTLALVLLVLAMIFAITSLINVCPLYLPFGISTRKK